MDPMGASSTERGRGWRVAYSSEGEKEPILGKDKLFSPTYCVKVV
jgi:hypothetical protein